MASVAAVAHVYIGVKLAGKEVRNWGKKMDELLIKGKGDILMLIQALDKERSCPANNGCGARKSAARIVLLRRLVRPGAWSCLRGDPWKGFPCRLMELEAGQLTGNSHTFLVLRKNEGYRGSLTGKGKNDFRLVFSADF